MRHNIEKRKNKNCKKRQGEELWEKEKGGNKNTRKEERKQRETVR